MPRHKTRRTLMSSGHNTMPRRRVRNSRRNRSREERGRESIMVGDTKLLHSPHPSSPSTRGPTEIEIGKDGLKNSRWDPGKTFTTESNIISLCYKKFPLLMSPRENKSCSNLMSLLEIVPQPNHHVLFIISQSVIDRGGTTMLYHSPPPLFIIDPRQVDRGCSS